MVNKVRLNKFSQEVEKNGHIRILVYFFHINLEVTLVLFVSLKYRQVT